MKDHSVSYEVVREHNDEHHVLQDIAIRSGKCDIEILCRLGRHLKGKFAGKSLVFVNIFDDRKAALSRGDVNGGNDESLKHRRALYVRSWDTGLHHLIIYPDDTHKLAQVIEYSSQSPNSLRTPGQSTC